MLIQEGVELKSNCVQNFGEIAGVLNEGYLHSVSADKKPLLKVADTFLQRLLDEASAGTEVIEIITLNGHALRVRPASSSDSVCDIIDRFRQALDVLHEKGSVDLQHERDLLLCTEFFGDLHILSSQKPTKN